MAFSCPLFSETTEVESNDFSARDNFGNSIIDQAAVVSSSSGSNSSSSKVRKESKEYVSCAKQVEQRLSNGQSKRHAEYYFKDKTTGKSKTVVFYTLYDGSGKVIKTDMVVTGDPAVSWHGKNPPIGEGKKSAGGAKSMGGASAGRAMSSGARYAYAATKAYEDLSEKLLAIAKSHVKKCSEESIPGEWKTLEIDNVTAAGSYPGSKSTSADIIIALRWTDEEGKKWKATMNLLLMKDPVWRPYAWPVEVNGLE
jgi:hypothetical protein